MHVLQLGTQGSQASEEVSVGWSHPSLQVRQSLIVEPVQWTLVPPVSVYTENSFAAPPQV